MYPILGRIGPILIDTYTAVLGTGVLIGLALANRSLRRQPNMAGWLDGLLLAILAAIGGGRAGFIWLNWNYYQQRPHEIWAFWQGGLLFHTAVIAGVTTLAWWCWWRKRPFLPLADLLAPSLLVTAACGWIACWLDGSAYGRETVLSLLSADLPDTFGIFAVRYQTQLLGLLLTLAGLPLLRWPSRQAGQRFLLIMAWLQISRLPVTWLRGDFMPTFATLRADLLLEALLAAIALLALVLLQYTHSPGATLPGPETT